MLRLFQVDLLLLLASEYASMGLKDERLLVIRRKEVVP